MVGGAATVPEAPTPTATVPEAPTTANAALQQRKATAYAESNN